VSVSRQNLSLSEAASRFLASLASEERGISQQEVYKFVRWFGWEQPLARLSPPEVANYAQRLSLSDTSYMKNFGLIRAFLIYASKQGWCKSNLAAHFKTRLGKTRLPASAKRGSSQNTPLTRQGYAELEAELVTLKGRLLMICVGQRLIRISVRTHL